MRGEVESVPVQREPGSPFYGKAVSGARLFQSGISDREPPTIPLLGRSGYVGKGDSTLIAAYPKVGKTTLLTTALKEWAREGHRCLVLTEESLKMWAYRVDDDPAWDLVHFVPALDVTEADLMQAFTQPEEIVVMDTLRSILGLEDEKDNSAIARAVNPLIGASRRSKKTFVALHHVIKSGGDGGRGIAGGHALLGCFDAALEIHHVANQPKRRSIKTIARLLNPPELLYERQNDGTLVALGEPDSVARVEVANRIKEVMSPGEWMTRKDILEALGDPKPSATNLGYALDDLVADGEIERNPVESRPGARYKYRLRDDVSGVEVDLYEDLQT